MIDFTLTSLDGKTVSLSDYQGRVVFLNFWATWCVPCEKELPEFQQFQAQQPPDGAVILAVNVQESADQVTSFLTDHDISGLTVLLDSDSSVANSYGIYNLPVTFVIDQNGHRPLSQVRRNDRRRFAELSRRAQRGLTRAQSERCRSSFETGAVDQLRQSAAPVFALNGFVLCAVSRSPHAQLVPVFTNYQFYVTIMGKDNAFSSHNLFGRHSFSRGQTPCLNPKCSCSLHSC